MSKETPPTSKEAEPVNGIPAGYGAEVLAEYTALRNEIIKRIEIRHQLLAFLMIAFGTLLTVGAKQDGLVEAILIYPLLALAFAFAWMHNDMRIKELGDYISEHVEDGLLRQTHPPGIWWEHYIAKLRKEQFDSHGSPCSEDTSSKSDTSETDLSEPAAWSAFERWWNRLVLKATEVFAVGVIGFTQALAVVLAVPRMNLSTQDWLLSGTRLLLWILDIAVILPSCLLLRKRRESYGKPQAARNDGGQEPPPP